MMYSIPVFLVLMISGLFPISTSESSSLVYDLVVKTLLKTFDTPISSVNEKSKLSVNIMLENDVFNLDDALRLFIQQFLVALFDGNIHLLPDDWESRYPAYARIIEQVNNILDLLSKRTLSEVGMKDIRPLVKTLTPTAFIDLQRLRNTIENEAKKEEEKDKPKEEEDDDDDVVYNEDL